MTDERQALFEQIEKRADSDFVSELLAFAAERLMTVEVEALTGAAHGERTPERAPKGPPSCLVQLSTAGTQATLFVTHDPIQTCASDSDSTRSTGCGSIEHCVSSQKAPCRSTALRVSRPRASRKIIRKLFVRDRRACGPYQVSNLGAAEARLLAPAFKIGAGKVECVAELN